MWRTAASVVNRKLAEWVGSWILPSIQGGAPGRGLQWSHAKLFVAITEALENGTDLGLISQDLKKAFDRISPWQAIAVLSHIGLPKELVDLLTEFYCRIRRVWTTEGCTSESWKQYGNGILQGCPFSVLLIIGMMTAWDSFTHVEGVDRNIFIDYADKLKHCSQLSDQFDAKFGFILNKVKTQVAGNSKDSFEELTRQDFGYGEPSSRVELLGLVHDLCVPTNTTVKKKNYDIAVMICARIRRATLNRHLRSLHIRMLVLPMWT